MSRGGPWRVLGIAPTDDVKAIRKAYADKLRAMDVDRDASGYAALRQARDTALYLAKQQSAVTDPELEADEPVAGMEMPEIEVLRDVDEGPLPKHERRDGPDVEFITILFPDGEYSEAPLTDDEWARADVALASIVDEVRDGELARQHAADMWVADCLARAWPRSSMLLERAAAAFDWEKERGQIHEGPAQAFLNARLRGMHFLADLEQPGHWAHGAWNELSMPGKKGLFGRFRANSDSVRKLLVVIRENFPELEAYLDREKVQSWEEPVGSPWFGTGAIIIAVFMALQLLGMCSRVADKGLDEPPTPVVLHFGPELEARRQELTHNIFGPETTFAGVEAKSPKLARLIEAEARGKGDTDAELLARSWIMATVPTLGFEQLVQVQQLRLEYALIARREGGTAACAELLENGNLPVGKDPPAEMRERERVLARKLLESGALSDLPEGSGEQRATVPGTIMAAVQRASGLTPEKARAVAGGGGTVEERCVFRTALMAQVLRQPGRVDLDLLRIL